MFAETYENHQFSPMFPCFRIVADTKFPFQEAKVFPKTKKYIFLGSLRRQTDLHNHRSSLLFG
jgi:hypothetical protein